MYNTLCVCIYIYIYIEPLVWGVDYNFISYNFRKSLDLFVFVRYLARGLFFFVSGGTTRLSLLV